MSKKKGSRYERRVVKNHTAEGIVARKVPLSGAMEGYKGDIVVADHFRCEVKARKRAHGFKKVRDWLGPHDFLFLQEIGRQGVKSPKPLVVMPWAMYVRFMKLWGDQEGQP